MSKTVFSVRGFVTVAACCLVCSASFAGDALSWLPRDVNAVLRMDIAGLYASPLSHKEEWATKARESFQQHEAIVPPGIDELICVADLDYTNGLRPLKEYAIARPRTGLTLPAMSALMNVDLSQFQDHSAVTSPRGTFVVAAEPAVWLAVPQGGRQTAARWLASHGQSDSGLDRLKTAVAAAADAGQINLVLDLAGAVDTAAVASFLEQQDWKLNSEQRQQIAKLLSTADLLSVNVTVAETIQGRCTVTFTGDAQPLAAVAPEFAAAILQSYGASSVVDEHWKWTVSSHALEGTGPLTLPQVRRLLSLVHNPVVEFSTAEPMDSAAAAPPVPDVVGATQKYVKSVRTILDDLQETLRHTRDNHALWYERSGRKIDDLPMVSVDPDALEFGGKVSSSLRYQGQVERTMNVRAGTAKSQSRAGNSYYYGSTGPYGGWVTQTRANVDPGTIDKAANQQSQEVRFSEWKQIEDGFATLKRELSAKLMAAF
ncbi:hypothetical protein GC163_05255 [bacterium]|nr:hypothetical protein [bacterium]